MPHEPQKLRSMCGEERKRFGSPAVKANPCAGKMTHATLGAPAALRQLSQWQSVRPRGSPEAR